MQKNRQPAPGFITGLSAVVREKLRGHGWWLMSLFFTGLGAKFWFIFRFGTPVPFADQWEDEAANTYIPYYEEHYSFIDLFSPWRLHRIFFTRACNLGLLLLNGQWDNRLEIVFNAIIHCLILTCIGWMLARLLGKKYWPVLWMPLLLALALPFAWENTLWGFQSQHYFLFFFSIVTIRLLAFSQPYSIPWRLGMLTAIAALFTMASGFFAAAIAALLILLENLRQRESLLRNLPTLLLCAIILITGVILKPNVPAEYSFQASSLKGLLTAFGKNLAWPFTTCPWFAFVNLFPIVLLGVVYFRSKDKPLSGLRLVLGIGLWVILQDFGLAYGRGKNGAEPVSRYMDLCNFISIVDFWSVVLLLKHYQPQLTRPRLIKTGFAVWAISSLVGLCWLGNRTWRLDIPDQYFCQQARLESMRSFLATDKVSVLELPSDCLYLPVAKQAELLRNPHIQRILPDCLCLALPVTPEKDENNAFVFNGSPTIESNSTADVCWGSYSAGGTMGTGEFTSHLIERSFFPFLEIPVSGDLGDPNLSLELVDVQTGAITPVTPRHAGKKDWTNIVVKTPSNGFKIVARSSDKTKWFAFRQPRELGRLSLWAMNVLRAWKEFLAIGLLFLYFSFTTIFAKRALVREYD